MEVRLSDTRGVQADSLVSIRAGSSRHQATAGALLKKPMRFPSLLRDCRVLQIEVLRKEASVPLVLHPEGEEYCVEVHRGGGEAARLMLAVKDVGAETAAAKVSDDGKAAGAAEANEYLAKRGVLQYIHRLLETLADSRPARPFEFMLEQLSMLCRAPELQRLAVEGARPKSSEVVPVGRVSEHARAQSDAEAVEEEAACSEEFKTRQRQEEASTAAMREMEAKAQAARNAEAECRLQQLHQEMQRLLTEAAGLKSREDAAASRVAELQAEALRTESRANAAEGEAARLLSLHSEGRIAEAESRQACVVSMAAGNAEAESRLQQLHQDVERLTAEAAELRSNEDSAMRRKKELLRANAAALSRTQVAEDEAQQLCLQATQLKTLEESTARSVAERAERQARCHLEAKEQERVLAEGRLQQLLLEVDKLSAQVDGVRVREEAAAKRKLDVQAESAEAESRAKAAEADLAAARARHEAAAKEGEERLRTKQEEAASLKAQADALSRKQAEADQTVAALKISNAEAERCVNAQEKEVVSLCNDASELRAREDAADQATTGLRADNEAATRRLAAAEREQDRLAVEKARLQERGRAAAEGQAAPSVNGEREPDSFGGPLQGPDLDEIAEEAPPPLDRDAEVKRRDNAERRVTELEAFREHLAGEVKELESRAETVAEEVRCLQVKAEAAKGKLQEEETEAALLSMGLSQQRAREDTVRRICEQVSHLSVQEGEMNLRELAAAHRLEELKASSQEAERRALAAEQDVKSYAVRYEELVQREQTASKMAEKLQAQTAELEAKMGKVKETVQVSKRQEEEDCLFGQSSAAHNQSTDSTRFDPCDASLGSPGQSMEFSLKLDLCDAAGQGGDQHTVVPAGPPASELPEVAGTPEPERRISIARSRMLQHISWSHEQCARTAPAPPGEASRRRGQSLSPASVLADFQVPHLQHLGPGAASGAGPRGPRAAARGAALAGLQGQAASCLTPTQQGRPRSLRETPPLADPGLSGAAWQSRPLPASAAAATVEPPAEAEGEGLAAPEEGPAEAPLVALCARRTTAEEEPAAQPSPGPELAALCARRSAAEEEPSAQSSPGPELAVQVEPDDAKAETELPALCARQSTADMVKSDVEVKPVEVSTPRQQVRRVRVWVKDPHEICKVVFEYGDGTERTFGQDGGQEQAPFDVPLGEHIVKLHSRCRHETKGEVMGVPYMHEGCCFETNKDWRSNWYGGNGGSLSTFTASDGHHITGFNTLGGLKSGVPVGIEEQTLVNKHDLACAGHLCDLALTGIQQLAIENNTWDEVQTRRELEWATARVARDQASTTYREPLEDPRVASLFEEMCHQYVARAEGMYDAVARNDQDAWENLVQGSASAGADFQRLRAAWSEAAHLGSQVSRSDVCETIAEAARETVFCISCGGQGCGLCKAHRDFVNWSKRPLGEVQMRRQLERATTRDQASTRYSEPPSAFQHFPRHRAEWIPSASGPRAG